MLKTWPFLFAKFHWSRPYGRPLRAMFFFQKASETGVLTWGPLGVEHFSPLHSFFFFVSSLCMCLICIFVFLKETINGPRSQLISYQKTGCFRPNGQVFVQLQKLPMAPGLIRSASSYARTPLRRPRWTSTLKGQL